MDEQINLFDCLGYPSIEDLDEEKIAEIVGCALNVKFRPAERYGHIAEISKIKLTLRKCNENRHGGTGPWLSCDWWNKTEGGGMGAESIKEAVDYYRYCLERCKE